MKLNQKIFLIFVLLFIQLSFSATIAARPNPANQEYLIKYVDNEIANTELKINNIMNKKISDFEANVFSQYNSFVNSYKVVSVFVYSMILAILFIVLVLIINTYGLAKKTQRLYQTPQIYKPNIAITRQNPFYFVTDGDIFKLLGLLDSWLDEDDYIKRIAVLMYYLPDKLTQIIWENLEDKNLLINTLLNLDGVDQAYVTELAESIKGNISNFIDKTDALGTVFDKLPEHHRNKVLKTITEQNILPKGYVLRFNDIFKQPKTTLKEKLNEIPVQTLALAIQTINKSQTKIILTSLQNKKEAELHNYLKLLEDQRICQDSIDKAKEFIVKYFNYGA
ncbi:MAG: hypothetical protein PHF25_05605 [Candidatus Margulisbacteria bacterium]|nr:hypothetical protein [Candidatus Margulisiibacteriota bacterium]